MIEGLIGAITAALGGVLGVVIWSVRQEGRINLHTKQFEGVYEKFTDHEKRHEELRSDILYIRQRIDDALGGRKGS